ncbi:unnamed protein product [Rotaria sp. Silwood2]|nr:unnamed protein product [Rotaria sp. Silwood2]
MTEKHQHVLIIAVREILSQLNYIQKHNDLYRLTTAGDSNSATTQSQDLHEILNILSAGIETLNNDQQRLSNELLEIQNSFLGFRQELSKFKTSIERSKVLLQDIKQNQCIVNRIFASLQETINGAQTVSYDGIFVWKITNVKDRMSKLNNRSCVQS